MKAPELHKLKIKRTAHYYTIGASCHAASEIWLVFHGYGQLASRIIRKFDHLDLQESHIIAPEGLNKFYFKRNPLILGASWMTKHQRLDEIEDYLSYINQVVESLQLQPSQSLNVLGFSQGSATMMRWLDHARPKISKMVNWAGEFPPDIDYDSFDPFLTSIDDCFYCVGDDDEFLTPKRFSFISDFIKNSKADIKIEKFVGTHEINRDVLAAIVAS